MKQEILDLQNRAIKELINKTQTLDEITFRAPTGSGKTFMMAKFMDEVLKVNGNIIFLVSTLSKGGLAKQNYDKFKEYLDKEFVNTISPYLINTVISSEEKLFIPTENNVYILPRDLYKSNSKLMQGPMEAFLQELTQTNNKKIYLIRDESHQATNNLDSLSDTYFTKIFNFSATPKLQKRQEIDVKITDEEAEQIGLIKKVEKGKDTDTFEDAVKLFLQKKEEYNRLLNVHPCLIVQISNKDKADEELNTIIKPILNKYQELKWMVIVDKLKDCDTNDVYKKKKVPLFKWKEYVKDNQDTTDIIIFKLAISEGWDIPRACMLYQIRDTDSKQLDEQVVGRVRRNPRLTDFENLDEEAQKLATTSWIWGVVKESEKKIYEVKAFDKKIVKDELKIKTTRLKPLKSRASFNIDDFLNGIIEKPVHSSIFTLYRKYQTTNNTVKEYGNNYSSTIQKWYKFNENIESIKKYCDDYFCDYSESMILNTDEKGNAIEVTFPNISYYIDTAEKLNINNWVWIRRDENINFAFDSLAEKEWADILKSLCAESISANNNDRVVYEFKNFIYDKFIWGKNYIDNSNIKYEYYMNGNHFTYPDFILKDNYGRIHIFEVKSVNKSNSIQIDNEDEYQNKILELSKCYKQASILTEHIFYLPIMSDNDWNIKCFNNGNEETIRLKQFIENIKNSK